MKAILLAAGMGTRLGKQMPGIPKGALDIGGITPIENTVRELRLRGIRDIAIVVGYQAKKITGLFLKQDIRFYINPFFQQTNSIVSLWEARDFLEGDDLLLFNADLFFESPVLDEVIQEERNPVLFADKRRKEEGDYKLYYNRDQVLIDHGKELTAPRISGEYIGIAKVGQTFLDCFRERLDRLIVRQKHELWWENVLYSFIGEKDIHVKEIPDDLFWAEIDVWEDYQRILQYRRGLNEDEGKRDSCHFSGL